MNSNYKRRSITIPVILDEKIMLKFKELNYTYINDLIIELIELGIIKMDEDYDIKHDQRELIYKIDNLIRKL